MAKMSDELKRTLGIIEETETTSPVDVEHINRVPTVFEPKELTTQFAADTSDKATDYKKVRSTLHELVDITAGAMAEALDLAKETQHPRAFEVFNTLASTVLEASKSILSIHKDMEDKSKENPKINAENVIQNNFYMSTQEALDEIKKNRIIDITP